MNWTDPSVLLALATFIWTVGFTVLVWWSKSDRRVHRRLDDHDLRINTVETTLKHRPGMQDVGEIYTRIDEVDGDLSKVREMVGKIGGTLDEVNNNVRLLMSHHIPPGADK